MHSLTKQRSGIHDPNDYCQNYCMYFYDMLHVVSHYMTGRLHVQLVHRQTGLCKEVFSFTERPKKIFFMLLSAP